MECRKAEGPTYVPNNLLILMHLLGFSCGSAGKESTFNAGDLGLIPGLGRSPGEGKGYPFQYSDLENSMDYTVHGVTELDMTERLSFIFACIIWASQVSLMLKNLPPSAGDVRGMGSIPGLGRSCGGGPGNPLQHSCLENPVDKGTWQATVLGLHRVVCVCVCILNSGYINE